MEGKGVESLDETLTHNFIIYPTSWGKFPEFLIQLFINSQILLNPTCDEFPSRNVHQSQQSLLFLNVCVKLRHIKNSADKILLSNNLC